jgi:hypothetical protein
MKFGDRLSFEVDTKWQVHTSEIHSLHLLLLDQHTSPHRAKNYLFSDFFKYSLYRKIVEIKAVRLNEMYTLYCDEILHC